MHDALVRTDLTGAFRCEHGDNQALTNQSARHRPIGFAYVLVLIAF